MAAAASDVQQSRGRVMLTSRQWFDMKLIKLRKSGVVWENAADFIELLHFNNGKVSEAGDTTDNKLRIKLNWSAVVIELDWAVFYVSANTV